MWSVSYTEVPLYIKTTINNVPIILPTKSYSDKYPLIAFEALYLIAS